MGVLGAPGATGLATKALAPTSSETKTVADNRLGWKVAGVALWAESGLVMFADEEDAGPVVKRLVPDGLHPPGCVLVGSGHGFLAGVRPSDAYKKPATAVLQFVMHLTYTRFRSLTRGICRQAGASPDAPWLP